MSATVDANILIHASNDASPYQGQATTFMDGIARGPDLVILFWPTLLAYIRIATHPSIFGAPTPLNKACANVETLLSVPHIRVVGEGPRFWSTFTSVGFEIGARGDLVSDTHVVALMREHGVGTIWTQDRDFRKFDGIQARDPFGFIRKGSGLSIDLEDKDALYDMLDED